MLPKALTLLESCDNLCPTMKVCYFIFFFSSLFIYGTEENFILMDGTTGQTIQELGRVDERMTPGSTFKIALSLMGFDRGILKDQENPIWPFHKGYDDFLESWKCPQTPQSWMKTSCVWYSRLLANQLGFYYLLSYVGAFDYGNLDASDPDSWLNSTLKISPREQVVFIKKMVQEELPVSRYAIQMTKQLVFIDAFHKWKLFGKTGQGSIDGHELGWFVGWIEKDNRFYPFAYTIRDTKIDLSKRIPRVKELLMEHLIF